jgi:hypothetical protein
LFPGFVTTGGPVSLIRTVTVNDFASLRAGVPLSVTRTVIVTTPN